MWPAMMAWLFAIFAIIEGVRASILLICGSVRHSRINKENGVSLLLNAAGLAIAAAITFLVL